MLKKTLTVISISLIAFGMTNCDKFNSKQDENVAKSYAADFPWGVSLAELKKMKSIFSPTVREKIGYTFIDNTKKLYKVTVYFENENEKSKFDESYHKKKFDEILTVLEKDYGKALSSEDDDKMGHYWANFWETDTTRIQYILLIFDDEKYAGHVKHEINFLSKKYDTSYDELRKKELMEEDDDE